MKIDEVIAELEDIDAFDIINFIRQQDRDVESLRCCGNCRQWLGLYGAKCRHKPQGYVRVQSDKCERWEK